jgi:hypothetical protein
MGSNFLVAAMVPSLAFVIAVILVFDPILRVASAFRNPEGIYQLVGFSLFLFIFTVIIGFTLTALNTYILKIFEGYVIFPPIRFLYKKSLRIHQQKANILIHNRDKLIKQIRDLQKYKGHSLEDLDLEELKDQYYSAVADYSLIYPDIPSDVLPTSFGNILKAAENYSGERYGLDGVHFWPRLVEVISKDYKMTIDSVRNELSFLVNMSILSFFFSLLCVIGMFISFWTATVASGNLSVFAGVAVKAAEYLLAAALGFLSCNLFYKASILSVGSFGLMIRSSFDLFRIDLLKRFGIKRPMDSDEEIHAWQKLNDMIVLGSHSLTPTKIDYCEDK